MKLLKNERAYRRWATSMDGFDTYKDRWRNEAPTAYPCWVYCVCTDYGMEETSPVYLYDADVSMMLTELRALP
jgi:hypothetical protein